MSNSSLNGEVFASLVALDAYNRRYGEGIVLGAANGLGHATFLFESVDQAASFYARAYSYNGEIVIAYRGTDQPEWDDTTWGDVVNGWGLGGGILAVPQVALALDFYKRVVEQSGEGAQISLTGHSLGGGLAGFIGSVFGKSALVFDPMTYTLAANTLYRYVMGQVDASTSFGDHLSEDNEEAWALRTLVYGDATPWAPSFSQVKGYYVAGEVLSIFLPARHLDPQYNLEYIDAAASLGMVDLHSQPLLTLLLYGEKQVSPQRTASSGEFLTTSTGSTRFPWRSCGARNSLCATVSPGSCGASKSRIRLGADAGAVEERG